MNKKLVWMIPCLALLAALAACNDDSAAPASPSESAFFTQMGSQSSRGRQAFSGCAVHPDRITR